jgi:anthranilate phosphoribosyltransferase
MPEQRDASWPGLLEALLQGKDLNAADSRWAMDRIMSGEASDAQIAAFLVALRAKGVTSEELLGIADTMLGHARRIEVPEPSLDIVGTGGDRAHTVNISTMAAITAAGAGVTVVKHGNRAASSSSGTADVLEALGVHLTLSPDQVVASAARTGITFCFAQAFHPSMRYVAVPRRDLGISTVFNVLGPLTNPAQPTFSAVGVADRRMAPLVAGVFARRGRAAAVFRGDDGLDELTISTTSTLWWVAGERVGEHTVDPERFGLERQPLSALRGGTPAENAQVVRELLAGKPGPVRDAVLLNAGVALALVAAGHAGCTTPPSPSEIEERLATGMANAAESIDSGAAAARLEQWAAFTLDPSEPVRPA